MQQVQVHRRSPPVRRATRSVSGLGLVIDKSCLPGLLGHLVEMLPESQHGAVLAQWPRERERERARESESARVVDSPLPAEPNNGA